MRNKIEISMGYSQDCEKAANWLTQFRKDFAEKLQVTIDQSRTGVNISKKYRGDREFGSLTNQMPAVLRQELEVVIDANLNELMASAIQSMYERRRILAQDALQEAEMIIGYAKANNESETR